MYLRDVTHSSYNADETGIDAGNAAGLQVSWTISTGAAIAAGATVADGVLYYGDWKGQFHAVDARTGDVLWQRFVGTAPQASCWPETGVSSQAAVVGDDVYVGGGDSAVYALDRRTGEVHWRVPLADPSSGSYLWSSITPYNGALYVGVASLGDCPLVRGALVRIDLADPTHPLIRYLYPENEQGGGIWSTPAIDPATNTVYVTTGTGEQDADGGRWGGTFASFDAQTLEMKAHFFLPSNSVDEDIEWGSSPTLFAVNGVSMTAATGKDGVLYALSAQDLQPVWQIQLAAGCICPECGCGSISTPAWDGERLYVGAGVRDPNGFANGSVWAIDPAGGTAAWYYDTDGVVIAPVTLAGGLIYASTTKGLIVLDAATGNLLWNDGGHGMLYSQAVVTGGTVYCTYVSGDTVAWRIGAAAEAQDPPDTEDGIGVPDTDYARLRR